VGGTCSVKGSKEERVLSVGRPEGNRQLGRPRHGWVDNITMKNGVFWVVTPCGSCKNRRFGGTWRLLHQGDKNR
jgi:hypothetical protein